MSADYANDHQDRDNTVFATVNNYSRSGRPSAHQRRRLALARRLLASCGEKTLDYGCGFGDVAWAVSDLCHIVGVDVDAERVAIARREFSPIRFEQCSTEGTAFRDGEFQTVFSSVVIHWTGDADRYLREVFRVLEQGGQFVLLMQNQPVGNNFVRRLLGKPPAMQGFWNEDFHQLLARVRRHGFEIEEIDCFYEAPAESFKSAKEALVNALMIPFRLLHVARFAPYYGIRARKVGATLVNSASREEAVLAEAVATQQELRDEFGTYERLVKDGGQKEAVCH